MVDGIEPIPASAERAGDAALGGESSACVPFESPLFESDRENRGEVRLVTQANPAGTPGNPLLRGVTPFH